MRLGVCCSIWESLEKLCGKSGGEDGVISDPRLGKVNGPLGDISE